jgi:hypothetical protein
MIVAVLAMPVFIVVGVGALLPKHHVATRSAAFRATPDRLFSFMVGQQNWRPDVKTSEVVPDRAGAQLLRETTRDGQTITYEITENVPPTTLQRRIVTQNLPYSGTWTFSLRPVNDQTVVRITEDGEVYNPIFRFVSRFILGQTRTIDGYLQALANATGQKITITD